MILITLLCSVILQLQVVPMASAYFGPKAGPIRKEVTIYLVDDYYDEVVATVTISMEYTIWLYYMIIEVTEVAVTIDYVWQRFDGYMLLNNVGLETGEPGEEPWDSYHYFMEHWRDFPDIWNHNWQNPETYEAYPNVFFNHDSGQTGKYGIWKVLPSAPPTWRLIVDGNYLYVSTTLTTDFPRRMQYALQFNRNVVILYRNLPGWAPIWFSGDVQHFYLELSV